MGERESANYLMNVIGLARRAHGFRIDKSLREHEKGIVDLLGVYIANQNKIELYVKKIEYCARQLDVPFINLYRVVKIHEICHAVQHLGLDQRGDAVDAAQFNAIPPAILEPLAEYWTWIVVSSLGSDGPMEAFFELDACHPQIYRNWHQLKAYYPEIIRMNWIKLRIGGQGNCTFGDLLKPKSIGTLSSRGGLNISDCNKLISLGKLESVSGNWKWRLARTII